MSKWLKILGLFLSLAIVAGLSYLYAWEKPKLENFIKAYVENLSQDESLPFYIKVKSARLSLIPLQLEFHNTQLQSKAPLKQIRKPIDIEFLSVRPSLLDLMIGRFWINEVQIKGSQIELFVDAPEDNKEDAPLDLKFDFNDLLRRIPISEISLSQIQLSVNYNSDYMVLSEQLYLKAYNEKSSLILTLKDPEVRITDSRKKSEDSFPLQVDLQVMMTQNTLSLSKLALIRDSSFILASGHMLYKGALDNITDLAVKTRVKSEFELLKDWSNYFYKNSYFEDLSGELRVDTDLIKKSNQNHVTLKTKGEIDKLKVGKIRLGKIELEADLPDPETIQIHSLIANLSGNTKAQIKKGEVKLGKKTELQADIQLDAFHLHDFLKEAEIADIPVWLTVEGQASCKGFYARELKLECPGNLKAKNLLVKNKDATRTIIQKELFEVQGQADIGDTGIAYKAQATSEDSRAKSQGFIDFAEGFNISYDADHINLGQLGPIAELDFSGTGTAKGSIQGDSRSALFNIDVSLDDFEFQDYYFGNIKTRLDYKLGTIYFRDISGQLESTRYQGDLELDLLEENIKSNINLPFFRMEDIQQAIIKKVDLDNRFLGSGSGKIELDTPFETALLNFSFESRLFKGSFFEEDYSEARLRLKALDGIIILQEGTLIKEQTQVQLKGTIDHNLDAMLYFGIEEGFLQNSTRLKKMGLPLSGQFTARGSLTGSLAEPKIKVSSEGQDLIFNKKKYGDFLFSFDNSDEQMNIQAQIDKQLDFLVVVPESESETIFLNLDLSDLDLAPVAGFFISDEPVHRYLVETSGHVSGRFDRKDFWQSEFSATIRDVAFHYRANRINKKIPTNIELKNETLYMNEIRFTGDKQFIKISQPETQKRKSKFVINSKINISLFKLFLPFFEKIDGTSAIRMELDLDDTKTKMVGSAYLSDSFFQLPGFPHGFENIQADLLFNQNRLVINSLQGDIAGGKVIGGGEVGFGEKLNLMINTEMEDVNINFPEGFKTRGRATINLSGQEPPFLLSGQYRIAGGLIDSNLASGRKKESSDFLADLLRKEVTTPLMLNLDVATEDSVEVRSPIGNAMIEGYMSGGFRVFDKITSPRLEGEVHFERNSVIRLRENQFQVTSSSFQFDGESPINPRLNLRANTRVNSYDIDIFLQGRADKPLLNVSSQPPLPENQVISMLALGTMPDQFAQTASPSDAAAAATGTGTNPQQTAPAAGQGIASGQAQGGGFEVGTALLGTNPLGRELDQYGVDVQFSSAFDDQSGAAVPRVTLRKRVGRKIQLSGSHSTGNISQTEGRVTYEIDNNLSTIFRVTDRTNDLNNLNNVNAVRQNNPFGLDLEYRLEFE